MYIHNLNRHLIKQGHTVRVMLQGAHSRGVTSIFGDSSKQNKYGIRFPYDFEGVEVMNTCDHLDAYRWADVMVTHLDFTHFTVLLGNDIGKPVVHIVHNHHRYNSIENAPRCVHVCYNSEWIANILKYDHPSVIVPPAVDYEKYNVNENPEKNPYITLINLNTNKGGRVLQRIAKLLPEKKFLAVRGSYDKQITDQPDNVTIIDNTSNILPVYRQTRLLLMPSQYESWGMTATEAMCSGIPVICTPTPGLKENCGTAGNYIDKRKDDLFDENGNVLDDTDQYDVTSLVKMIKAFDNKHFYKERSTIARKRAKEHNPLEYCQRFENFLYEAAHVKLKAFI